MPKVYINHYGLGQNRNLWMPRSPLTGKEIERRKKLTKKQKESRRINRRNN